MPQLCYTLLLLEVMELHQTLYIFKQQLIILLYTLCITYHTDRLTRVFMMPFSCATIWPFVNKCIQIVIVLFC